MIKRWQSITPIQIGLFDRWQSNANSLQNECWLDHNVFPIGREFKDCHLNPNINLSIWWPHWLKIKGQIFPLVWIWWQNIVLKYLSIEKLDYLHKCGSMILRNAWSLPWIPFVQMVISTIVDIMMMKLRTDERPVLKYWSPKRVTSFMNTNWIGRLLLAHWRLPKPFEDENWALPVNELKETLIVCINTAHRPWQCLNLWNQLETPFIRI